MRLLRFGEYHNLMGPKMQQYSPTDDEARQVLEHATEALPDVGLENVDLASLVLEQTHRSSQNATFFHVYFGMPNTYVVIVYRNDAYRGYILFDIGAEYCPINLFSPYLDEVVKPTEVLVDEVLEGIQGHKEPFCMLAKTEGTWLRGCWLPDGYGLEYRMVTPRCRYYSPAHVPFEVAKMAFHSYAFGRYEWAKEIEWTRTAKEHKNRIHI